MFKIYRVYSTSNKLKDIKNQLETIFVLKQQQKKSIQHNGQKSDLLIFAHTAAELLLVPLHPCSNFDELVIQHDWKLKRPHSGSYTILRRALENGKISLKKNFSLLYLAMTEFENSSFIGI